MDLADLEWWSICLVLSDIRNGRWYDYHCLFDMYLYTYRLCVCFLLLICQRTKYLLILAAPSFRRFCYRRKNLFWFQWFSSGDPSIPQNHRLHSASKFVAGTVTYIFLREHYGTLASLNFYHQVVLPADSLPICRTAACHWVLECLGCMVTLLEYVQLGSTRYPVTVAKWTFLVIPEPKDVMSSWRESWESWVWKWIQNIRNINTWFKNKKTNTSLNITT